MSEEKLFFEEHGYRINDPNAPQPVAQGTSLPVVTFPAFLKSDGSPVILDTRTFDPALHTLDAPEPKADA